MFDTKVGIVVRNDLKTWQRLDVVAFIASGSDQTLLQRMGVRMHPV